MNRGPVVNLWGWGWRQDVVGGKDAKKLSVVLEEDVWGLIEVDLSCGRDVAVLESIIENEEDCAFENFQFQKLSDP